MAKHPLVSVIVPTFRSGPTIGKCLESIKTQKNAKVEIIVVDEFSDDQTPLIARKYGKLYQVKGERSVARNFGADKSHGEYLLFIDSDMILSESVIASCVEKSQKVKCVVIPEVSIGNGFWSECRILERKCMGGDNNVESARFFPRKSFYLLKGYDETMAGVEDWDLHQRLLKKKLPLARADDSIIHDEGTISLYKDIKKKFYYGQVFNKYRERHPDAFRNAFIRTSFLRNINILAKDPLHMSGMVFMKGLEGVAILLGMLQGMLYGQNKKYHYR